jgi:choline dehydrogenase-like flavoprotein
MFPWQRIGELTLRLLLGSSAATAYLTKNVIARSNLTIVVNVRVEKVLFSQLSSGEPRAVGVELSAGPATQKYRVTARREVLVTAGAVGTPHILMLSGIGVAS